MRTWTLSERQGRYDGTLLGTELGGIRVKPENECSFTDESLIKVIEAEPVKELLERIVGPMAEIKHWSGSGGHPVLQPLAIEVQTLLTVLETR